MLKGVEQTLNATGMAVRRLTDEEMFLELKRAMNPLFRDDIVYRRPELTIDYRSAREQAANTHIEDDQETYIKIGGLLYSFLSLKDLPDATFPGIFRELLGLDFPLVINTEVEHPGPGGAAQALQGTVTPHDRGSARLEGRVQGQRGCAGCGRATDADSPGPDLKLVEKCAGQRRHRSAEPPRRSKAAGIWRSRNESLRIAGNGRCTPSCE